MADQGPSAVSLSYPMDQANGAGPELGDLDFQYADADTLELEIAEIYSYSEQNEFQSCAQKFQDFSTGWKQGKKVSVVRRLLEAAESANPKTRKDAVRAILYVAQGTWAEHEIKDTDMCDRIPRVISNIQENCLLLYRLGAWPILVQLLRLEAEKSPTSPPNVAIGDSRRLRDILSTMCTITEVFRHIGPDSPQDEIALKKSFCDELSGSDENNDIMAVILLKMITAFCNGTSQHFPVKKLLLLLWKTLILSLGGIEELKILRAAAREREGLPPGPPDTTDVVRTMRPASPPATLVDMIEVQQQRKSFRMNFKRQSLVKQSSMDDQEAANNVENQIDPTEMPDVLPDEPISETPVVGETQIAHSESVEKEPKSKSSTESKEKRSLPWQPKAALRDIDNFLAQARMKFVGFQLPNDTTTLAGLPEPVHEGLRILEKHKYTPLSEVQIMLEMKIERHPYTHPIELADTPIERLYQALLPHMPQHMISLLKILLAAAPTSKAKTESVNILADLLPTHDLTVENCVTAVQSTLLAADINRHKEILVKAISAILLLLVKHVKISHCLQFEYLAQQLMFANCIPLVLKFFNQNVISYAAARHTLLAFEFPRVILEKPGELTSEMLEGSTEVAGQLYCWRNVFACINLLRILNKLTKNKHSRVMMLVVFKSAPILKRALKVRQAMLQLYALKLLKMQTKYLGRQWRKTNMKTMSAIYQKVRHRLGDDWAYGGDLDARPWDFQGEEFSLQAAINDYHRRRYDRLPGNQNQGLASALDFSDKDPLLDITPVDNCFLSVLGRQFDLLPDFKENYRYWLKCQVYDVAIEWEKLLETPNL